MTLVPDGLRKRCGQYLGRVTALLLLKQVGHESELAELVVEEALPDPLDPRIGLELHAAPVVVYFACFVQQPLLEPGLLWIDDALVLGHVLLLDRRNLRIQLARDRVGEHRADGHVVVVRLMLAGHDGERVELRDRLGASSIVGTAEIVQWVPMLPHGGPPRDDIGVALDQPVGVFAFDTVHQGRVAIEVVEVFQESEAVRLRQIGIRLGLGHAGRHLDGNLLEADGRFERRLVGGIEPIHQRLLVLLDASDPGQGRLEVRVHSGTGMREPECLAPP